MKYHSYYYCSHCRRWIPKDSDLVIHKGNMVKCGICHCKLRTRPNHTRYKRKYIGEDLYYG